MIFLYTTIQYWYCLIIFNTVELLVHLFENQISFSHSKMAVILREVIFTKSNFPLLGNYCKLNKRFSSQSMNSKKGLLSSTKQSFNMIF